MGGSEWRGEDDVSIVCVCVCVCEGDTGDSGVWNVRPRLCVWL
jgi:hypothetical protein